MEIRPMTAADLRDVREIDGTVESMRYLHVDRSGEGLSVTWKVEERPLREKVIESNPYDDERWFTLKQVVEGAEDGVALVAIHDGLPVAAAVAKPDPVAGVLRVIDLRVDSDYRRQGLGSAMLFQIIQAARETELRAVAAEVKANNEPAQQLLAKLGFEVTGLDAFRLSNHDLVKETVTLFWYAPLQ